jgi:hypothetical protein
MNLNKKFGKHNIQNFAYFLQDISNQIGFKVSSRGWGYILEQKGYITKDQFSKVEGLINRCRKDGYLPVDFVAEEEARMFKEIHRPTTQTYEEYLVNWIEALINSSEYFEPNWWEGEKYYIQMLVEKVDLVTLFQPICRKYHIPIGNSKGWSSIIQRADYAKRFKQAREIGLHCVLLYCGDHDPDGLRISDTLRKNLEDIMYVHWTDGTEGYDPDNLIIDRFGLNYNFIISNNLTWIDNLITGSGKNLSSPSHPNFNLPYVQNYLQDVGVRKCEANSVIAQPSSGRLMCEKAIKEYLGNDAEERFKSRKEKVQKDLEKRMKEVEIENSNNLLEALYKSIEQL